MSSEVLREPDPIPEENAPVLVPDQPKERAKIIDMPEERAGRKIREVEASKPTGDSKTVLARVRAYDKIRFARVGEGGWHDAEVIGWVDKDHLKMQIIDNGEKTGRVIELHKADISAVDITEGSYDYLRKPRNE